MLAADATRAEVLSNLKLILLGGMQEPGHALGICVWALLTHPETLARVRADRGLIRPAVEEALRWHSPVGTQTRQVTQPVTLSGVELKPGDALAAVLASANRDERHWPDADRYDIDRRGAHAAFGLGAHHCAGAPLARYEVRLPLEMLLDRFPKPAPRPGPRGRALRLGVPRTDRAPRPVGLMEAWTDAGADADLAEGTIVVVGDPPIRWPSPAGAAGSTPSTTPARMRSARSPTASLTDAEVECPCHGSIFNMRTGEALTGPALESVRTHRVRVEDGRVQVLIAR